MRYQNVCTGSFIERPNRFIAKVKIDGKVETCHVKNTGRCKELLVPGAMVVLEIASNPERSTKYDVIAVYKGSRLINMDSQVPNAVVFESLKDTGLVKGFKSIRREVTYGDSRIDIFAEGRKKTFVEVKGVTLEKDGVVLFPDAPTERGIKHIHELMKAVDDGYDAIIFFLIQMSDVRYFAPNYDTHREFGEALKEASEHGVRIVAYDCTVTEDSISMGKPVKIHL